MTVQGIIGYWLLCGLLGFCLALVVAVRAAADGSRVVTDVSPVRHAVALVIYLILGPIGVLMDVCHSLVSWLKRS